MSTMTTSYRSVVGIFPSPLLLALLQGVLPADAGRAELIDRIARLRLVDFQTPPRDDIAPG